MYGLVAVRMCPCLWHFNWDRGADGSLSVMLEHISFSQWKGWGKLLVTQCFFPSHHMQPALFYIKIVLWTFSKIGVSEYGKSLITTLQPNSGYDGAWAKECIQTGWRRGHSTRRKHTVPLWGVSALGPSANLRGLVVKSRHWSNRITHDLISFKDAPLLFHTLFCFCSAGLHTLPVLVLCFHLLLLNSWTLKKKKKKPNLCSWWESLPPSCAYAIFNSISIRYSVNIWIISGL